MAESDEWEEYHLTESGWIEGSSKHDFQKMVHRCVPEDRLLTVKNRTYMRSHWSGIENSTEIVWGDVSGSKVKNFLDIHGLGPAKDLIKRG